MEIFPQSDLFQGRCVAVVGAGQSAHGDDDPVGNGRAISLLLARAGAQVICIDKRQAAAQQTVAQVESEGGRAAALEADIALPHEAAAAISRAHAAFGRLDGLVLNVGVSDRRALPDVTVESWGHVLDVNLRGHLLCVQAALPVLEPAASIVFISSMASLLPIARNPAYECAKAALSALCRATAIEGQARGIRANTVLAGLIDTPMGRAASAARPDRAAGPLPLGRQGSAWDVAHAVSFLLSPQAAYVNAVDLPVDGGLGRGIAMSGG